ncbi:MAG: hypothetical protein ABSD31_21285, partial [Candidatus Binataceae bacterium]
GSRGPEPGLFTARPVVLALCGYLIILAYSEIRHTQATSARTRTKTAVYPACLSAAIAKLRVELR